jgi:hypothetical protein
MRKSPSFRKSNRNRKQNWRETIGEARMGENQLGRETEPASDAPPGGLGGREREARMGESLGWRGKG